MPKKMPKRRAAQAVAAKRRRQPNKSTEAGDGEQQDSNPTSPTSPPMTPSGGAHTINEVTPPATMSAKFLAWFPDALTRSYAVPPVDLPIVRHGHTQVGGVHVLVPMDTGAAPDPAPAQAFTAHPPSLLHGGFDTSQPFEQTKKSTADNVQGDFAERLVRINLDRLAESTGPQFTIYGLNFGHKVPEGLKENCEVDVGMTNKAAGVLLCEVKAKGSDWVGSPATPQQQQERDDALAKELRKVVSQLNEDEKVTRHKLGPQAAGVPVHKCPCLPYIHEAQLQRVLLQDTNLAAAVCGCVGAGGVAEAVSLCLVAERLSSPASPLDVTPAVLAQLQAWWQRRMPQASPPLSDKTYLAVVEKLMRSDTKEVALPTRAKVRQSRLALSEVVAAVGWLLSLVTLTQDQLALLASELPSLFICGPPGTGKTVVLLLEGLKTLRRGMDVHVVAWRKNAWAASLMLAEQLRLALGTPQAAGRVFTHLISTGQASFPTPPQPGGSVTHHRIRGWAGRAGVTPADQAADVAGVVAAIQAQASPGGSLVIVDEALFDAGAYPLADLVRPLLASLRVWAAGIWTFGVPSWLQRADVTLALRATPRLVGEVQAGLDKCKGTVLPYTAGPSLHAPTDGPAVTTVTHTPSRDGHAAGDDPQHCRRCGELAGQALRDCGVCQGGALSWRDALLLCGHFLTSTLSPGTAFCQGLQAAGVPLRHLGHKSDPGWAARLQDVALAATDAVWVAEAGYVAGLERCVLLLLSDKPQSGGASVRGPSGAVVDFVYRVDAISRATTHAICVVPDDSSDMSDDDGSDEDNTVTDIAD